MRMLMTLVAAATVLTGAAGASTRPCRDAQGRVVACPKPPAAPQHRCKNAAGQFVPCDHQAARPIAKAK